MPIDFEKFLKKHNWILTDGAIGTNLFNMGLNSGDCPELWNEKESSKIKYLIRSFIESGSRIILTNSFGANFSRLKLHGLQNKSYEISKLSAEIAKEVIEEFSFQVALAGSIGPTGEILQPYGSLTANNATEIFIEQAQGLVDGGVDILWLETISSEEELLSASEAFKKIDFPWCVTMSFDSSGRTMMGVTTKKFVEIMDMINYPPIAFGANCGIGPADLIRTIKGIKHFSKFDNIIAKGNAGIPQYINEKIKYDGSPELMAKYALLARDCGAKIIGGCCGTSPNHIRAMKKILEKNLIKTPPDDFIITKTLGNFSSTDDGNNENYLKKRKISRRKKNNIL